MNKDIENSLPLFVYGKGPLTILTCPLCNDLNLVPNPLNDYLFKFAKLTRKIPFQQNLGFIMFIS